MALKKKARATIEYCDKKKEKIKNTIAKRRP